jgi:hypothetical protein
MPCNARGAQVAEGHRGEAGSSWLAAYLLLCSRLFNSRQTRADGARRCLPRSGNAHEVLNIALEILVPFLPRNVSRSCSPSSLC